MKMIRRYWPLHTPGQPEPFGPSGTVIQLTSPVPPELTGSIIITQAVHDGQEWIHASLAWTDVMPDYQDLTGLKAAVFGPDREAYQVFPAASRHVSIHDYALHLWGRADGLPVLPLFGEDGTI
jgi:hypothetical protein